MPALEERVAYLEGRGEEHAGAISEVRTDIRDLRVEVRDLRGEVRDLRDEMGRRFEAVDRRFEHLESKFDTRFIWMMGFQFLTLMAVIAALLNARLR